jgi:alkanesulfonate monooxygenase SsuD/methylene tetrahydromethanopterin reductase-like flavin-dependent oxidoreductase (luciferase family)
MIMTGIKFGAFMQQDSEVGEEVNLSKGPDFHVKAAELAERLGYDSFWENDHWMLPKNKAVFDCWTLLSAISVVTKKIMIGSLVTPAIFFPPLALAKRVQTAHMLSGGRIILGLGAGWYREESSLFGMKFEDHEKRIRRLEEEVVLIQLAWKSRNPVEYNGNFYNVHGVIMKPDSNLPPLWFGGTSDKIIGIAAKYGNGWIPYELSLDDFSSVENRLKNAIDRVGRKVSDMDLALCARIVARKKKEEVAQVLRSINESRDYVSHSGQKGHLIAGTYEECEEELGEYIDAGVKHLVLSPQPSDQFDKLLEPTKELLLSDLR